MHMIKKKKNNFLSVPCLALAEAHTGDLALQNTRSWKSEALG